MDPEGLWNLAYLKWTSPVPATSGSPCGMRSRLTCLVRMKFQGSADQRHAMSLGPSVCSSDFYVAQDLIRIYRHTHLDCSVPPNQRVHASDSSYQNLSIEVQQMVQAAPQESFCTHLVAPRGDRVLYAGDCYCFCC